MKTNKTLKEIKEIEGELVCLKNQFEICLSNNWDEDGLEIAVNIRRLKQKAQELADKNKFNGGCKTFFTNGWGSRWKCGGHEGSPLDFCPTCQDKKEIQEINKEIQKS